MATAQPARHATGNWLLDTLPPEEFELLGSPRPIFIEVGQVYHDAGQRMEHVYFPTTGLVSSTTVMVDGTTVEAVTVGREGMSSLPLIFGVAEASMREMGQVPGETVRVSAGAFRDALPRAPRLRQLAGRYADAVMSLLAQAVACNRLHQIEQRCARWLLMTHDRVMKDDLALTHEVLSYMLGTNRPTVTLALQELRTIGAIDYRRGKVTVIDRQLLESIACECYGSIATRFDAYRAELGRGQEVPGPRPPGYQPAGAPSRAPKADSGPVLAPRSNF